MVLRSPFVDRPNPTISSGAVDPSSRTSSSEPPSAPSSRRMVDALPELDAPILVIEADITLERHVHDALAQHGLRSVGCTSLSEALAYLDREGPPALVLLDLLTHDTDGWSALRGLRAR